MLSAIGAGGGILALSAFRARDLWTQGNWPPLFSRLWVWRPSQARLPRHFSLAVRLDCLHWDKSFSLKNPRIAFPPIPRTLDFSKILWGIESARIMLVLENVRKEKTHVLTLNQKSRTKQDNSPFEFHTGLVLVGSLSTTLNTVKLWTAKTVFHLLALHRFRILYVVCQRSQYPKLVLRIVTWKSLMYFVASNSGFSFSDTCQTKDFSNATDSLK